MLPRPRYDCYLEVAIWNVLGLLGKNSPEQNCPLDLMINLIFLFALLINYAYICMRRDEFQLG